VADIRSEEELYPLVRQWLESEFLSSGAVETHAKNRQIFTEDVSQQADGSGGLWSRPDLAAAVYSRARYVPSWAADLYSFEVKTRSGVTQSSVYEAFAHTRFVNYSYLVWQGNSPDATRKSGILELCSQFGLGAITMSDPGKLSSYSVEVVAARREITPSTFDAFIRERFSEQKKAAIRDWLAVNGWARTDSDDRGI